MFRRSIHKLTQTQFNIVILGPPGGGKGTISKKILKDFDISHISTGDLLREHVRTGTDLGKIASGIMSTGGLVPDKLVLDILVDTANKLPSSLLLDGFPRTVNQAKLLSTTSVHVSAVVVLEIPHNVIVERISNRWIHEKSGRTYAYDYNPPKEKGKDDITGEPLSQRPDDKPEAVEQRLTNYDKLTAPVIDYYSNLGVVARFAGSESNLIYPEVKKFLSETALAQRLK